MRKYLIETHFINGEATFGDYVEGVRSIIAASHISKSRNYGLDFGLKLTVDGKHLSGELQGRTREETGKLPHDVWLLYDPEDRGPGTSYRQILFNPTFSSDPGIVVDAILNEYVIDTEEALGQLMELLERTEKDGAIYATGSRDIPVVLATNERNSNLRIIQELFHSLAIGSDKLRVEAERRDVTPAYAEIGESTSGLYVLNFSHTMYPELTRSVVAASQMANMNGFATDYYVAMKSSQLGKIAKGYVKSRENKFHAKRDEQEEFGYVTRFISGQTRELGNTEIRDMMMKCLQKRENAKTIAQFYPMEDVELVRNLMIESLGQETRQL